MKKYLNKALILIWLFLVIAMAMGCTPERLPEEDLRRYVLDSDNGLLKEKKVDGLTVRVYHKPTGLMVAQELKGDMGMGDSLLTKVSEKYGDYAYFVLELSYQGHEVLRPVKGTPMYAELLNRLAFRMGEYVSLKTDRDEEVPLADFHYPRTYGASRATRLLLVFNRGKLKGTEGFRLRLEEFGLGTGRLDFRFDTGALEEVPGLEI